MKPIILGTAGHIDHGKTSLIKAATGINTDRLKEEQERGITIELGFAFIDLPSGLRLGIVDVPGHEKFVKNMVAGATGIDLVVMVIAADEGVMPQTREHMEICTLLGVEHGFVALTKIDMVDEELAELAVEDVRDYMQGTFLEDAPIIPVSSVTGKGVEEFVATLDDICGKLETRPQSSLFRLPVDRVFTMKGFGTVITGTLVSGSVNVGDSIEIYPSHTKSKVRGIQVHGRSVESALSGQRTAINFQGLEKTAIERGEVISAPGVLSPSYMLDVNLTYLESTKKKLKNRAPIRFHAGTAEILGQVLLLDRDAVEPGETVVAQLRLDTPVALVRDDRFVIRSYSPIRTIGGGRILNPIPVKHKRFREDVIQGLADLRDSEARDLVAIHARMAGLRGASFTQLKIMTNLSEKALNDTIAGLLSSRQLVQVDKDARLYVDGGHFDALKSKMLTQLGGYHQANPLKEGMLKGELKSKFPGYLGTKLFTLMLNQLVKEKAVVAEDKLVRLADHKVSLAADLDAARSAIMDAYRTSALQPPYFKELGKTLGIDAAAAKDVLQLLVNEGQLIKVKEDLYFEASAVSDLRDRLVAFLKENGEIDTPAFKDMTGASRKYVIPLIEHFDATNVTIRIGDVRKLRKSG